MKFATKEQYIGIAAFTIAFVFVGMLSISIEMRTLIFHAVGLGVYAVGLRVSTIYDLHKKELK